MDINEEPISDEQYVDSSNKIAMAVTQVGADFSKEKAELSEFIVNLCSEFVSDEDKSKISNEIYGKLFDKQIDIYLRGCEYFVNTFREYCLSNNIEVDIVDVDSINMNNGQTQQGIIDSTTLFLQIVSERFDNPIAFNSEELSFEERISEIVSLYIDTAFIMGLTDAQNLNYLNNKSGSLRFGGLTKLMEA